MINRHRPHRIRRKNKTFEDEVEDESEDSIEEEE